VSTLVLPQTPPPTPPAAKAHLAFIDGLRAIAALFVMVCHAYFEPANGYYASRLMNHLGLTYGHIAVDLFIVVSGFCLMLPIVRRGGQMPPLRQFFTRRAIRILPPYYASLLLSCLFIVTVAHDVTGTVWDNSLPLTAPQFFAHLLLIHDLPLGLPGGSINYPLWSIAVECQVYLFLPLLALSFRRVGTPWTLAWAVSLGLLLHGAFQGRLDSATPWYLGLFTLGAAAAREALSRPQLYWRPLANGLWALVALVIIAKGKLFFASYSPYLDTIIGLAAALTMAATFGDAPTRKFRLTRWLSWSPLARVGLFSYSLYLVHAPLLHACDLVLSRLFHPAPVPMFLLLLGMTPLIVAAAYGFYLLFEKPFLTARRPPAPEH
jgi:peptidoglycan/LPS O-acetylase OafA/YrhL